MTPILSKTIRQAIAVSGFALAVSSVASTSSFAFSSEAQQMCTGDAFRLCSSEIPSIPAVTACMIKNKAQLSPGCRMVVNREMTAPRSNKVAAQ